jgi:beta-lactamase regulating signal transducer with metallopeptidase domain
VLALAVWAGLRLCKVRSVRSQKAAWGLVLTAALLMPLAMRWQLAGWAAIRLPEQFFGLTAKPQPAAVPLAAPVSETEVKPTKRLHTEPVAQPELNTLASVPAQTAANTDQTARATAEHVFHPAAFAGLLYLAVCVVLLARLGFGLALAVKLWITAQPVTLSFGLDRFPTLRVRKSDQITSPVSVGSGVILPASYTSWEMEKLRIVLAHERSHIRQGDFYLQLLAGIYTALFWFSPLGWWLKRKLTDLGEALSDHAGQEEAASRVSYVQILLEFAALPRPTLIGVAMASRSNLSARMERLLDESSFRRAFAGSRRRALVAVLLVSTALFAAAALVRVEAAGQAAQPPTPPTPATAEPAPTPEPADVEAPEPPEAPEASEAPEANDSNDTNTINDVGNGQTLTVNNDGTTIRQGTKHGYSYSYSSNGDSYALVSGPGENITFSGNWNSGSKGTLEKARRLAHGKFLWFTRDGKSYFLDDPAVVAQIEDMYKPMEALGRQQEELGRQQKILGLQQKQLGSLQEQASVPSPDISKEMAELNAAMAKLQAKMGKTTTQEQLADLQGKLGDLQGKLGALQGKLGEKRGAFGEQMGKLGAQQGKLGSQQGKLGAEQSRIATEAAHKVKSIIDQSLSSGKAHPVE